MSDTTATKACPKCREQIDRRAKRCPHCSSVVGVDPVRLLMIAIITILVVVLFGGFLIRAVGG